MKSQTNEARDLAETGIRITAAANEQIGFRHPDGLDWTHISFCQIAAPLTEEDGIVSGLSAVAIQPGKLDRSPCGTGCSARMAVLHARGILQAGDRFIGRSIIGSRFGCRVAEETTLAGRPAIVPEITGRAWITGMHQHMLDPADPWPHGYKLSDTWPHERTDMTTVPFIDYDDADPLLTWPAMADALAAGHKAPRALIDDLLMTHGDDAILNRAAWIDGLGIGLKTVSIFPGNHKLANPLPMVQGVVVVYDGANGSVRALVDGGLVTKWKTAGDSVLGARLLARPESKRLLIVGSGAVATALVDAFSAIFPAIEEINIWSRTAENAQKLATVEAAAGRPCRAVTDLGAAAAAADIVSCATMTSDPILKGDWIGPGTHVDLIGAFTPQMREADDALITKAELFVDARETTLADIGEIRIPLETGVIAEADIRGDLYDLCNGAPGRSGPDAITLFKNGGGAHLDLMTANLIRDIWAAAR